MENRRLKKTESLKENEDTTTQGWSLAGTKFPSTLASRPVFTNYQSSGVVSKPPLELQQPLYSYADHIPKPKVIYITDADRANEMVPSLNG